MVGLDSLLQALEAGEGDESAAAQQLRAEIERLEQHEAELVDYDDQEEDEGEEMVSKFKQSSLVPYLEEVDQSESKQRDLELPR